MASYLNGEATANGASAEIQLVTISAAGLLNGDKQTQNDLFDACKSLGFFYLDCRDHPSKSTTSLVDRISAMALDFYDLPLPSKEDWAELSFDEVKGRPFALVFTPQNLYRFSLFADITSRYKPAGKQEGSVKGKKDGWEGLIVSSFSIVL
jgi:isopenicillin N synthase-like dioxygenase